MRYCKVEIRKKDEFKIRKKGLPYSGDRPQFVYSFPKESALIMRSDVAVLGWMEVPRYSWQSREIDKDPTKVRYYLKWHRIPFHNTKEERALAKRVSEWFFQQPKFKYLVLVWERK